MILGMPLVSAFAYLSWPIVYIVIAIIIYFNMAKQDKITAEYDKEFTGGTQS